MIKRLESYIALLVICMMTSCGDDILEDFTKSSDYHGVEGKIFHLNRGCGNPYHDEVQYPDNEARIEAFIGPDRVNSEHTDINGRFQLHLEPGTYDIRIYPFESYIDERMKDVTISEKRGTEVRRSYQNYFVPWQLTLYFHGNVLVERINEIIQENNMESISVTHDDYFHRYIVKIPHEYHVQEMQILLEKGYDEVKSADVINYECVN